MQGFPPLLQIFKPSPISMFLGYNNILCPFIIPVHVIFITVWHSFALCLCKQVQLIPVGKRPVKELKLQTSQLQTYLNPTSSLKADRENTQTAHLFLVKQRKLDFYQFHCHLLNSTVLSRATNERDQQKIKNIQF